MLPRILCFPVLATLALLPAVAAHAGGKSTPCLATADKMVAACQADVADNYFQTVANCTNIGDRDERASCWADAAESRREENHDCWAVRSARRQACDLLNEYRYDPDPLLDTGSYIDPDDIPASYAPNPYVSLQAGRTSVLRSSDGEETIVVYVTDETRDILGVACRVVVDIALEVGDDGGAVEYEAVEVTDDWIAQKANGDVVYCGELARNFEDGVLRDLDGSFEAGLDFAKAGVLFMNDPVWGLAHRQEFALGEAEDIVQYLALSAGPTDEEGGDNENFPCASTQCVKAMEFAPIEPDSSEYKYYLPGTGFVLAVGLEDGELTGDREELVCTGDSLDILGDPACGIDDSDALLETLCSLAPDAFCADD